MLVKNSCPNVFSPLLLQYGYSRHTDKTFEFFDPKVIAIGVFHCTSTRGQKPMLYYIILWNLPRTRPALMSKLPVWVIANVPWQHLEQQRRLQLNGHVVRGFSRQLGSEDVAPPTSLFHPSVNQRHFEVTGRSFDSPRVSSEFLTASDSQDVFFILGQNKQYSKESPKGNPSMSGGKLFRAFFSSMRTQTGLMKGKGNNLARAKKVSGEPFAVRDDVTVCMWYMWS